MTVRSRRIVALLCGMFASLTLLSAPAAAAPRLGGFEFSADFNSRLESRHYSTAKAGTHIVFLGKARGCHDVGQDMFGVERFRIELHTEGKKVKGKNTDVLRGVRFLSCAKGGQVTFKDVPAGWAYFVLEPDYRGERPNRILDGRVLHP
jgi:hypothetical protein